jgi:hypothetical protein
MNSERNDAKSVMEVGRERPRQLLAEGVVGRPNKIQKKQKGISCDEKTKDAEVRERGKKINPGKHQAAIDVLISQGVVESGLGGSTGRSWRLNKSYPDEYGHVCNAVQDASDVLATVVCILVCTWSASGLHRLPH